MPGWSVVFADYSAVSSIWISGSQDPSVEMDRMHTLFACLTANGLVISDQLQGMILLRALPMKLKNIASIYRQTTPLLTDMSFDTV